MRKLTMSLLTAAAVGLFPGLARAQEGSGEATSFEHSDPERGVGVFGEAIVLGAAGVAPAGAPSVGAVGGGIFDVGKMRFGGGIGLAAAEGGYTLFLLEGMFGYVLHSSRAADFSLLGGVGLGYLDRGSGNGGVRVGFSGGGQARFFLAQNAALTAGLGLVLSVGKGGWEVGLGSGLAASFGFQYYFN